jgi:homoserine kinase
VRNNPGGRGQKISVRVPATSANLGSGFDCLGIALEVYLDLEVETGAPALQVKLSGEGESHLPTGPGNLLVRSMAAVFKTQGKKLSPLLVRVHNDIPLARGLGSSAAATVAGLLAGNALLGNVLAKDELLELATQAEGHPDNVAPALFGGCVLCVDSDEGLTWTGVPVPDSLQAVLFVPDFPMATSEARAVLPVHVPRRDAIYNVGRAALLVAALASGQLELLGQAMEDRLHQPYRAKIFPAMPRLIEAARQAGAFGACLSGAGSSILALVGQNGPVVVQAMVRAAQAEGLLGRVIETRPARVGATTHLANS